MSGRGSFSERVITTNSMNTFWNVSIANQRFTVRMAGDRSLRKAVEKITGLMSNVKV
jgi:hypothetical protein